MSISSISHLATAETNKSQQPSNCCSPCLHTAGKVVHVAIPLILAITLWHISLPACMILKGVIIFSRLALTLNTAIKLCSLIYESCLKHRESSQESSIQGKKIESFKGMFSRGHGKPVPTQTAHVPVGSGHAIPSPHHVAVGAGHERFNPSITSAHVGVVVESTPPCPPHLLAARSGRAPGFSSLPPDTKPGHTPVGGGHK